MRIVDLSLDIYDKAPTFWPDPKTAVIEHLKIANLKYNITQLVMSTHLGTHIDAPFHFFDDGKSVDQLDLAKCFGPAWVLDFTHKGPKAVITEAELKAHEDKIVPGARLIIRTGWDKVFPEQQYFDEGPAVAKEACTYLAEKKIACVAMDMPSVCAGDYVDAHHALLRQEIVIIEGLAHLDELRGPRVLLAAFPLRIKGRDGSPCRAIAIDGVSDDQLRAFELLETKKS